jgi:hypothetical protein
MKELLKIRNITWYDLFKYILSVIGLVSIFYIIIKYFSWDLSLLSLIISFLISFAISNLVLDKFTYSNNKFIRIIQRFIIYNIILIIIINCIYYILNFWGFSLFTSIYCSSSEDDNISQKFKDKEIIVVKSDTIKDSVGDEMYKFILNKKLVDSTLQNLGTALNTGIDKIVPNIGIGTAAGAASGAAFKASAGLPIGQRLLVVGGVAAMTAAGTKIGTEVATAIGKNINLDNVIKNSPHSEPNPERVPSPDPTFSINSPIEMSSPLQDLLLWSFVLDVFILILLIGVLIIIFNRYIVKYNLNFIKTIVDRYIPIKIKNWFNKYINTGIDYNDKIVLVIFIISTFLLFFFVLLKLIISSTLLVDIDSYINVHNFIHSK